MKLLDLDPQWLMVERRRVGFTFISPTNSEFRQSCFPDPPKVSEALSHPRLEFTKTHLPR